MLYDFLRDIDPNKHICIIDYSGEIVALGRKRDIELYISNKHLHQEVKKVHEGITLYIYLGKVKKW